MTDKLNYKLIFLFECINNEQDSEKLIQDALCKKIDKIDILIESNIQGGFKCEVSGDFETIDACHDILNREICSQCQFIRILDEVSDQIRNEAYPLLSEIEQYLRNFINESMTNVIGFGWWDKLQLDGVKTNVTLVANKNTKGLMLHPIELTQFDDLVDIIMGDLSRWEENSSITVSRLCELLNECETIPQLKNSLQIKIERKSVWDIVFKNLFEHEEKWEDIRKDLKASIIPIRHKVMHHRPVRIHELEKLKQAYNKVINSLTTDQRQLNSEEKAEILKKTEFLFESIREQLSKNTAYQDLLNQQKKIEEMFKPIHENQKRVMEPYQRMQEQLRTLYENYYRMVKPIQDALNTTNQWRFSLESLKEYENSNESLDTKEDNNSDDEKDDLGSDV